MLHTEAPCRVMLFHLQASYALFSIVTLCDRASGAGGGGVVLHRTTCRSFCDRVQSSCCPFMRLMLTPAEKNGVSYPDTHGLTILRVFYTSLNQSVLLASRSDVVSEAYHGPWIRNGLCNLYPIRYSYVSSVQGKMWWPRDRVIWGFYAWPELK